MEIHVDARHNNTKRCCWLQHPHGDFRVQTVKCITMATITWARKHNLFACRTCPSNTTRNRTFCACARSSRPLERRITDRHQHFRLAGRSQATPPHTNVFCLHLYMKNDTLNPSLVHSTAPRAFYDLFLPLSPLLPDHCWPHPTHAHPTRHTVLNPPRNTHEHTTCCTHSTSFRLFYIRLRIPHLHTRTTHFPRTSHSHHKISTRSFALSLPHNVRCPHSHLLLMGSLVSASQSLCLSVCQSVSVSVRPSVRPSVRLSVDTHVVCIPTAWESGSMCSFLGMISSC